MKTNKTVKKKMQSKWIRCKYPSRPEIYEAFAEWLVYPRSIREPKTQGEFAKLNEVSPNTLSSYKKKAEFWKKVKDNKEKLKQDIENKILLDKIVFPD